MPMSQSLGVVRVKSEGSQTLPLHLRLDDLFTKFSCLVLA